MSGSLGCGDLCTRERFAAHPSQQLLIPLTAHTKIPFALNKCVIPGAQGVVTIATNHPNIILFCVPFVKAPFLQFALIGTPSLSLFKLYLGTKKEAQKDQDANKPAVSSPKRIAASTTKLHSPGI